MLVSVQKAVYAYVRACVGSRVYEICWNVSSCLLDCFLFSDGETGSHPCSVNDVNGSLVCLACLTTRFSIKLYLLPEAVRRSLVA